MPNLQIFQTDWEEPEIVETGEYLHHDSTVFFDNIDNPEMSPRDRKNMRIQDDSRVK